MKDTKKAWAWVGVAVVVVAIVIAIFWRPSVQMPNGTTNTSSTPMPVYAAQGQVVSQFPTSLILDGHNAIMDSYAIDYSSSTNLYAVEYDSSSSMQAMFVQYMHYLPSAGWTITNVIAPASSSRGIYAENASSSQVSIAIIPNGTGSNVKVGYNP